jgi:glycosyltransferase involved in cell wall biosynthesis
MPQKHTKILSDWSTSLAICIAAYGRPRLLHVCLDSLYKTKLGARLIVLDDGSNYDREWLEAFGAEVIVRKPHRNHGSQSVATARIELMGRALKGHARWIYHTDADVLHDPDWLSRLLEMTTQEPDYPVYSLMNSSVQAARGLHMQNERQRILGVVHRVECPGASYLVRSQVLGGSPFGITEEGVRRHGAWDHMLSQGVAKYRCLVSETSYVEHFATGGIHDGHGDRCLNLTGWLNIQRTGVQQFLNRD